ncbi:hypothetical protein D3C79_759270 [compost metagenome]
MTAPHKLEGASEVEVDRIHLLLPTKMRVPGPHATAVSFRETITSVVHLAVTVGLPMGVGHLHQPVVTQALIKGCEYRLVFQWPGRPWGAEVGRAWQIGFTAIGIPERHRTP